MKRIALLLFLSFFILSSFSLFEKQTTVNATLKAVTVYRSGATLSHTASAALPSGDNEATIEDLS